MHRNLRLSEACNHLISALETRAPLGNVRFRGQSGHKSVLKVRQQAHAYLRMNKQTVVLIALFTGWMLSEDLANATTYEDIAGQWCGDVTVYVFTPNTLTVKFHDGRPAKAFKITKYTYTNNSVRIDWLNGPKESVTVFAEFSRSKMAQQQVGDLPRRAFHRC